MTLADVIRAGDLDSYAPKPPSLVIAAEDAKIVAEWPCPNCGAEMLYRPFSRPGGYRPFAVCRSCQQANEF